MRAAPVVAAAPGRGLQGTGTGTGGGIATKGVVCKYIQLACLLALDLNQFAKEKKVTTLLTHVYCIWQKLFEKAKCKARNWERRGKKIVVEREREHSTGGSYFTRGVTG